MALQVKGVEEQGDGVIVRCLQDGGAVDAVGVDVRPAWTLEVTKLLLICSVTTWDKKNNNNNRSPLLIFVPLGFD